MNCYTFWSWKHEQNKLLQNIHMDVQMMTDLCKEFKMGLESKKSVPERRRTQQRQVRHCRVLFESSQPQSAMRVYDPQTCQGIPDMCLVFDDLHESRCR
jgi:hypothetical protein